jgi:hypothetical protein
MGCVTPLGGSTHARVSLLDGQECSPGFFAADGPAGRDCEVGGEAMVAMAAMLEAGGL